MHYNTYYLEKEKKMEMLRDAKELAYSTILHELNTDLGFRRMDTDKTFSEIMDYLENNDIHFYVGDRLNYLTNEYYGQISATTLLPSNINYFIFNYLNPKDFNNLLNKYSLK